MLKGLVALGYAACLEAVSRKVITSQCTVYGAPVGAVVIKSRVARNDSWGAGIIVCARVIEGCRVDRAPVGGASVKDSNVGSTHAVTGVKICSRTGYITLVVAIGECGIAAYGSTAVICATGKYRIARNVGRVVTAPAKSWRNRGVGHRAFPVSCGAFQNSPRKNR